MGRAHLAILSQTRVLCTGESFIPPYVLRKLRLLHLHSSVSVTTHARARHYTCFHIMECMLEYPTNHLELYPRIAAIMPIVEIWQMYMDIQS